jgi:hypothetical protein
MKDDEFEYKTPYWCTEGLPSLSVESFYMPVGTEIIVEEKVPNDPYFIPGTPENLDEESEPIHSGKYFYLKIKVKEDLEPYAYWAHVEGTDKPARNKIVGKVFVVNGDAIPKKPSNGWMKRLLKQKKEEIRQIARKEKANGQK